MKTIFLLDVAAYDSYVVFGGFVLLIFLVACVLVEAFMIQLVNKTSFKKSFWTSFFVNVMTTVIGFALIPSLEKQDIIENIGDMERLLVLFLVTLVLEALLLKLFLKGAAWGRLFLTSLAANLFTYSILFFLIYQN